MFSALEYRPGSKKGSHRVDRTFSVRWKVVSFAIFADRVFFLTNVTELYLLS